LRKAHFIKDKTLGILREYAEVDREPTKGVLLYTLAGHDHYFRKGEYGVVKYVERDLVHARFESNFKDRDWAIDNGNYKVLEPSNRGSWIHKAYSSWLKLLLAAGQNQELLTTTEGLRGTGKSTALFDFAEAHNFTVLVKDRRAYRGVFGEEERDAHVVDQKEAEKGYLDGLSGGVVVDEGFTEAELEKLRNDNINITVVTGFIRKD